MAFVESNLKDMERIPNLKPKANPNENPALMFQDPSGSPPYQTYFMPIPQQIYPALPPMSYHEQAGMYIPAANPYERGSENSGWYPQELNPNYQPYYQPDFGTSLPPLNYQASCGYSPSYYNQSTRDTSPPRE